jgi:hypothetical protein
MGVSKTRDEFGGLDSRRGSELGRGVFQHVVGILAVVLFRVANFRSVDLMCSLDLFLCVLCPCCMLIVLLLLMKYVSSHIFKKWGAPIQ